MSEVTQEGVTGQVGVEAVVGVDERQDLRRQVVS